MGYLCLGQDKVRPIVRIISRVDRHEGNMKVEGKQFI